MNLGAGWLLAALLVTGFPQIRQPAERLSIFYLTQGFSWRSFAAAVVAGILVTLMTWMNSITTKESLRLFSALVVGYLLALGQMPHSIASGIEFFMALVGGAAFGYGDALPFIGWMVVGNFVGGVVFAAGLRLAQVAGMELRRGESEPPPGPGDGRDQREESSHGPHHVESASTRQRVFEGIEHGSPSSPQRES